METNWRVEKKKETHLLEKKSWLFDVDIDLDFDISHKFDLWSILIEDNFQLTLEEWNFVVVVEVETTKNENWID